MVKTKLIFGFALLSMLFVSCLEQSLIEEKDNPEAKGAISYAQISGKVTLGPTNNATVQAYYINSDGSTGNPTGKSTNTNSEGEFTLNIPQSDSPIEISATGGQFRDEASNTTQSISSKVTVILPSTSSAADYSQSGVAVSSLTTMESALAINLMKASGTQTVANIKQKVGEANSVMKSIFNSDPKIAPGNVFDDALDFTDDSGKNAMMEAAISMIVHKMKIKHQDYAKLLALDLTDGKLDGLVVDQTLTFKDENDNTFAIATQDSSPLDQITQSLNTFINSVSDNPNAGGWTLTDLTQDLSETISLETKDSLSTLVETLDASASQMFEDVTQSGNFTVENGFTGEAFTEVDPTIFTTTEEGITYPTNQPGVKLEIYFGEAETGSLDLSAIPAGETVTFSIQALDKYNNLATTQATDFQIQISSTTNLDYIGGFTFNTVYSLSGGKKSNLKLVGTKEEQLTMYAVSGTQSLASSTQVLKFVAGIPREIVIKEPQLPLLYDTARLITIQLQDEFSNIVTQDINVTAYLNQGGFSLSFNSNPITIRKGIGEVEVTCADTGYYSETTSIGVFDYTISRNYSDYSNEELTQSLDQGSFTEIPLLFSSQ